MKMYTVSVTDKNGDTETQAYFRAMIAYSAFKEIVETGQLPWRNCLVREGDTLLIAETISEDWLVELYEHTLIQNDLVN
jgi:hypothetical protein